MIKTVFVVAIAALVAGAQASSVNFTTAMIAKNASISNTIARKQATAAGLTAAVKNYTASVPAKLNKTATTSLLVKPNVTAAVPKVNATAKLAAAALILNHTMAAPKAYNVTKFNKTMLNLTLPKKNLSYLIPAASLQPKNLTYLKPKPINLTALMTKNVTYVKPAVNVSRLLYKNYSAYAPTKPAFNKTATLSTIAAKLNRTIAAKPF